MNIRIIAIALFSAGIGALIGVMGYIWIVGGDGTPSTDTTAPTLDVNAIPTQSREMLLTQVANADAEIAALQTQVSDLQAGIVAEVVEPTATPLSDDNTTSPEAISGRTLYRIDSAASRVTFTLTEVLLGNPKTVIGGTNEVAGDVIIDFDNTGQSQIGMIRINARTFLTDDENRNRALRAEILQSSRDEFEFIEFVPTALNNLPETIAIGETYPIEIVGDLTILNTSNSITFTGDVTLTDASTLSGTATVEVAYADWGISIPDAIGVSNVSDTATLMIEFVAREVTEE